MSQRQPNVGESGTKKPEIKPFVMDPLAEKFMISMIVIGLIAVVVAFGLLIFELTAKG